MSSMQKRLYMHTIGCQMNVYDSQQIARLLKPLGYELVPAEDDADLIIVNTCSVREKAEQKAFSLLGRLAALKQKKPGMIIAVGGCVAQQAGRSIFSRAPHVDLVFGTQAVDRIAGLIKAVQDDRRARVDIAFQDDFRGGALTAGIPEAPAGPCRFVTIMRGCNNFCTYCIVPYVRGREVSRTPDEVLSEIRRLVRCGAREVTLLGQNVNSYGKNHGLCSFAELLEAVNGIDDLWRIRFTTSHPKDLSADLMRCFGRLEKLCPHIHLPFQAGSDRVLKRMNRRYTRDQYLEKIERLRDIRPDIALSADIIVGFPGETDEDFQQTLDLMRRVRYDSVFAFKYSDRPGVPAVDLDGKVDDAEKGARLTELLNLQKKITLSRHQALLGTLQPVLVEGPGKKQDAMGMQWTGRTPCNKVVNFTGCGSCNYTGTMPTLRIERAFAHSLRGELAQTCPADGRERSFQKCCSECA